ncbi:alpha/beta fold hydrolase [Kitasatospora sp. NBC_01287]|uniref:thioesterase II family protein n=1 Tax=Kitasatospora sp. NBC_01287 TaxID=2903573 RepID=UPI002252991C|nr:alpha/beta fold hydrolase [Kitasatospora sp. NBC_01287]MCX4750305.1 alpha/beta fold hydrolase [Kitasatospora sp. NBC_01287]
MTTPVVDSALWIRNYHPAPQARARLVCFPHAGGSASYYFPVSAALSPELDVFAVQYPGRQDRRADPFIDTIDELADVIHLALTPTVRDGGPFAFFGHSMGSVLAFEVARRFEERDGISPAAVFASGRRAPSRLREENVHLRDDAGIIKEMRNLGGTDSRVLGDPELLAMVLPAIRNDYRAVERYSRGTDARIAAPIVVLTADDDPRTTVEEARAWSDHTTGTSELHTFTGGHFYLEQHAGPVINVISRTMADLVP